jgi:c-di-GMP-binding flagellar brake protein YcgR
VRTGIPRFKCVSQEGTRVLGQPCGNHHPHKEVVVSDPGMRSIARSHDRRRKPRICVPFHTTVRGVNNEEEEFNVETILDNVSGDGLYMRMMPSVKEGTTLSIQILLHKSSHMPEEASRILVEGVVLRTEKKAGGVCGVAVTFDRVRFA